MPVPYSERIDIATKRARDNHDLQPLKLPCIPGITAREKAAREKAARVGALRDRLDAARRALAAKEVTDQATWENVECRLVCICDFFECDTAWLSGASSREDALEFLGSCIVDQIDALWRPIEMHLIQNASSPDIPDLISTLSALVPTVSSRWNLSDLTSTLEALVHKRYPNFPLYVAQTD